MSLSDLRYTSFGWLVGSELAAVLGRVPSLSPFSAEGRNGWVAAVPLSMNQWKATTFNAHAETVRTCRAYRDSFSRRRCLVAADGWYEWKGEREDDPKKKQPWLFEPQDGAPIMLAGIWDRCETTDQGLVESFTVVTQPAGAPLSGYHDRAPVTQFGPVWKRWLDVDADVDDLLGPESADRFVVTKCEIR
jgi:putative SOS response-associated peptidase YedK